MHLTLRVLGRELLHVEADQAVVTRPSERPQLESSGGGQFELDPFGFASGDSAEARSRDVPRR